MTIETALAKLEQENWGKASAAKRGRRPEWPYVPIIDHSELTIKQRTEQIKGKAFATREEAVAYAQSVIDARKDNQRKMLADTRRRLLRQQYGVE